MAAGTAAESYNTVVRVRPGAKRCALRAPFPWETHSGGISFGGFGHDNGHDNNQRSSAVLLVFLVSALVDFGKVDLAATISIKYDTAVDYRLCSLVFMFLAKQRRERKSQ